MLTKSPPQNSQVRAAMSPNDTIEICIFLADDPDHQHGVRRWPTVPRIGDQIAVTLNTEKKHMQVRNVIWGDDANQCVVAIFVK